LDAVVIKLEAIGYSPAQAFLAWDEDCDEVLTVQEIAMGLNKNGVKLLDSEWK